MKTNSASKRVYTRDITVMHFDISESDAQELANQMARMQAAQQAPILLYDGKSSKGKKRMAAEERSGIFYSTTRTADGYEEFMRDLERLARRERYINAGQYTHGELFKDEKWKNYLQYMDLKNC